MQDGGLQDNSPSSLAKDQAQENSFDNKKTIETELELEELEALSCLDDELIELGNTGIWSEETSPVSEQVENSVTFDFPVVTNRQVQMYLNLFQTTQRTQFSRWLERSGAYKPMMEAELAKAGLPKDLVYLAMIESGYNQVACSSAKAIGLWQFMRATGRQYNLKVDRYVDERRDPLKSTKAAVTYLRDLYRMFDDWHLAVAAYNGGPGKIGSGLKRYKVSTFWELASKKHLRFETKKYVPKLIAAILIAKEPEKYGFYNLQYQKPLTYDTIQVGPSMSLDAVALLSGSTTKEIKGLNRELRTGRTPGNRINYEVKIPKGTGNIAQKNMPRLHTVASTGYKSHTIRKSDTLSKICTKYGINKTTLLKVNNLRSARLIAGRNLRIPYSTSSYYLLPENSDSAMASFKDSLILHQIQKGDTLSKIAARYQVPQGMIIAWNGLKNAHSIRAGQQLALYIDRKGDRTIRSSVAKIKNRTGQATNELQALKADKKKQYIYSKEPRFVYYHVKNGDSLWTISKKFSASTSDIKKWNNLKSNLIHPGSKLKLKQG